MIGLVDAPGGIHQILKNIDRNGVGTITIKILSINCIFAVDSNNFHTTVVCCPLLNYIRTILDNLYSSGCSKYLVSNRVNK